MARKSGNWHVVVRGEDGLLLTHQFYKKKEATKMFHSLGEEYVKTLSIQKFGKIDNGIYIKFDTIQIVLFKGESIKPYLGGV